MSTESPPGLRLVLSNPKPPAADQLPRTRAFAACLEGEWRIIRAALHQVGRFTYYRTEDMAAWAVSMPQEDKLERVPMRWNIDEGGEANLERVFRHRGRMFRLDSWYQPLRPAPRPSPGC